MSRTLAELAERRRQLVTLAAAQRAVLAQEMAPWRERLARVDQGVAVVRAIRRHPALLVGAMLLLAAVRPRGTAVWLQRGWMAWQIGRRLRGR
jgi:hypothetical protein